MKLHTYNAVQLFLTAEQKAKIDKVCFAYQMIYARLFTRVRHCVFANKEVEYARLINALKHEDEQLGTDVFSKYPHLVKGAELKVRSVFQPVKNYMDCHMMAPYLERERLSGNFALPILNSNNGKVEVPYLGELSKEGKTKGGLFLEFVRSRHIRQNWHAKAFVETSINEATDGAGILVMTPILENPLGLVSTAARKTQIVGLKEYAKYMGDKAKSAGAASKRMSSAYDCADHDFRQGSVDKQDRAFDMEKRALEFAPTFAKQIVEMFTTFGYCEPATPTHYLEWANLELDVLLAEAERLMFVIAPTRKQMTPPVYKFSDKAFCVQCGNAISSKIESNDVVCSKRNHDRISVHDAVANNTMRALVAKL